MVREQLLAGAGSRVAHPPRQVAQLAAALGNSIDRAVAHDAQTRLEPPQEAVPAQERPVILRRQQPGLEQLGQRLRRRSRTDRGMLRAVDELEELHGELHVDEASAAELGIVPSA